MVFVAKIVGMGAAGVKIGADVGNVCRPVAVAWRIKLMSRAAPVTGWLFVDAPDKALVDDPSSCKLDCWMLHLT